jgi:hypothetical protein
METSPLAKKRTVGGGANKDMIATYSSPHSFKPPPPPPPPVNAGDESSATSSSKLSSSTKANNYRGIVGANPLANTRRNAPKGNKES